MNRALGGLINFQKGLKIVAKWSIIIKLSKKLKHKGEFGMASVFDVAKYILEKLGKMSTWKLEKLCYYCQAWYYTWEESTLFGEEFQAWSNGPVCPDLYRQHKGRFLIDSEDLHIGDSSNLEAKEKDDIDIVLNNYGDWDAYMLREQTHSEQPWKEARGDTPDGVQSTALITCESMAAYYGSL